MKNFEKFILNNPQQVIGGKKKAKTQCLGGEMTAEREMTLRNESSDSMNVIDISWKENMIARP